MELDETEVKAITKINENSNEEGEYEEYMEGDVIRIVNPSDTSRPHIVKIEKINGDKIYGRCLYPSYHEQVLNGTKVKYKDRFGMKDHELLYSNTSQEMKDVEITDKVEVLNEMDFQKRHPRLYESKGCTKPNNISVFFCSRAIYSRRAEIWNDFEWKDYESNFDFSNRNTKRAKPETPKCLQNSAKSTPRTAKKSTRNQESITPSKSISKQGKASPRLLNRSHNNTPVKPSPLKRSTPAKAASNSNDNSENDSNMDMDIDEVIGDMFEFTTPAMKDRKNGPKKKKRPVLRSRKEVPEETQDETPSKPTSSKEEIDPFDFDANETKVESLSKRRSSRKKKSPIVEQHAELPKTQTQTPVKRKSPRGKVSAVVDESDEDSDATVQTPLKQKRIRTLKVPKVEIPQVKRRVSVTTKSGRNTTKVVDASSNSDSEGTNASNDDDFKRVVVESESDDLGAESSESERDSRSSESEAEYNQRVVRVKKVVMKNLMVRKVRRSPKKLMSLQLAARRETIRESGDDFEKAARRLHVSAVPDELPCRTDEFAELYSHLASAIQEGSGFCVYVSGIPGTGKTATFKAVLRQLQAEVAADELDPFEFVEINGMKLSEPKQAYSVLYEGLTAERVPPSHAEHLLLTRFTSLNPDQRPCVVLMDELDMLVTQKQSIVYNFFEWPNLPYSRLIVVAIANTMDLPERMLSNKVSSRLGLTRMSFQPYSHKQLAEIVESRLAGLSVMAKEAIELCARRVSTVCGDARRCLDVSRRAMEISQQRDKDALVSMDDINAAIKEMTTSKAIMAVTHCSVHQRLFLIACMNVERKTGIPDLLFMDVEEEHIVLCRMAKLREPNTGDLHAICSCLHQYRLIIAEESKSGLPHQKVKLNIDVQDVITGVRSSKHRNLMTLVK